MFQETENVAGKRVFLFVDNIAAQFVLEKGASKVSDINAVCAGFWLLVARLYLSVEVIRVTSKENPADAPSRGKPPHGASIHRPKLASVMPQRTVLSGADLLALLPPELL